MEAILHETIKSKLDDSRPISLLLRKRVSRRLRESVSNAENAIPVVKTSVGSCTQRIIHS
jgi:hypothetical protein